MEPILERVLAFENMKEAWQETRRNGKSAGVDHVSVRRFERHWQRNLWDMIADVRSNFYKPRPLRITHIPKRRGGRRRLAIPTVRDRVLQRAVLQVLGPRLDRKFLSCSYGYRPHRSLFNAVGAILRYRDRGLTWVLDADIDDFFSSVDLAILWELILHEVKEQRLLHLLRLWLDVGVVNADKGRGLAQGMPISPLFSNLFLHEMDWRLVRLRWALVRYADDFIVLSRDRAGIVRCREVVAEILEDLNLQLEPEKTHITSFDEGFEFLGVRFDENAYTYTWQEKRVRVRNEMGPLWSMWRYFPHGYQ